MSDAESQTTCEVCGAVAERQISGVGLVFKGSGFYLTDYGKSGSAADKAKGESGGSESAPDAKKETGAESKTASEAKPAPAASPAPAATEGSKKKAPKKSPKSE